MKTLKQSRTGTIVSATLVMSLVLSVVTVGLRKADAANTHSIDLESGSSQYLFAADSASLSVTGSMTVEAWLNLESNSGNPAVFTKWGSGADKGFLLQLMSPSPSAS